MGEKRLKTNKGQLILADQASITTGEGSSYTLLQDVCLIEKLAHLIGKEYLKWWRQL